MADHRSDAALVELLRAMAEFGCYSEAAGAVMRDASTRLEQLTEDARWGQRVTDVLGHEAVVRGWDRNGQFLWLEYPESSQPYRAWADAWRAV